MNRFAPFLAALIATVSLSVLLGDFAEAAVQSADSPVLLVLDSSGSMSQDDGTGTIKIDGAKLAMLDFLKNVAPGTPIGLRNYPSNASGSCDPGSAKFPIAPRDPGEMSAFIRGLVADGDTPTAEALEAAFTELEERGEGGTLVLVSDGESTCEPPCDTAKELAGRGVEFEAITIGFQISDGGRDELKCIADAFDGKYVDADDNEALREVLDDLAQPKLQITKIEAPTQVVAEAGSEPDGRVKITATIANVGKREASDVVLRLRFDLNGLGVTRPVVRLGNLAPGASQARSWYVWPGATGRDHLVRFSVIGSAKNSPTDAVAAHSFRVIDLSDAADAGPILKGKRRIAILGDSYSSGEGAENYVRDSDKDGNSCHQSRNTYLFKAFQLPDANLIACSGAIASEVGGKQDKGSQRPAQAEELKSLYGNPGKTEAVVLSLGGNNYNFGKLAKSCLIGTSDCSTQVFLNAAALAGVMSFKELEELGLSDSTDDERGAIKTAYESVNRSLNSQDAVRARGGRAAPIIVLGYPLPIPLTERSCKPMLNLLSKGEVQALGLFALKLNGLLKGIVDGLHSDRFPIYFVENTENALLPDHTVCDPSERAYARSLDSFDASEKQKFLSYIRNIAASPAVAFVRFFASGDRGKVGRATAELVHPNAKGYTSMTNAILRWSNGPGGKAAASHLATVKPAEAKRPEGFPSGKTSVPLRPNTNPILTPGTAYPASGSGYAPQSQVFIYARSEPQLIGESTSNENGEIDPLVTIPAGLENGQHKIELVGIGQDGKDHRVTYSFKIDQPWRPSLGIVFLAFSLLCVAIIALLLTFSKSARGLLRELRPTDA